MATQNELWHDITWEEKIYFRNTSSTNYGDPVRALYRIKDGKPYWEDLTDAGMEYYGVINEDKAKKEREQEAAKIEEVAKKARKADKKSKKSNCCGCCCCMCRCLWKVFCYLLPFGLAGVFDDVDEKK